jgi:hypothetical protein
MLQTAIGLPVGREERIRQNTRPIGGTELDSQARRRCPAAAPCTGGLYGESEMLSF